MLDGRLRRRRDSGATARAAALFRDHHARQRGGEPLLRGLERHAILRTLRTREARLDGVQVDFDRLGIDRIRRVLVAVQTLRARVRLDEIDAVALTSA